VNDARRLLLQLLQSGLAAVDGRSCTRRALLQRPPEGPVAVFAVGKAAAAMTLGAADALGTRLRSALVITRTGHAAALAHALPTALLIEAAHPVPDASSLRAGAVLRDAVSTLGDDVSPLFLISGGSSSLVEVLREGVSLAELQRCNAEGLAQGIAIAELNARRSGLSRLKGGGLTAQLRGRTALALFISDVPHDDPAVIGSGLLGPGRDRDAVQRQIIASADTLRAAVVAQARSQGLSAREMRPRFSGDALAVAAECVRQLRDAADPVLVWTGESTVELPPRPGRGGRNQHLALAAALAVAGSADLLLLAAGTDGTDGNSEDAGALVDGASCARMAAEGLDAATALTQADAGTALAASGDLIHTGPTGTNVGDLVIGMRLPRALRGASAPDGMV
jgi:hydroxypyruvate reductase